MTTPALADVPVRADGVEVLGELSGSGFRDTPVIVRRGDGQTMQLTPLLAHLLDLVDGARDADALAGALGERVGRRATADDVRTLLAKLVQLGLLCGPDGAQPEGLQRSDPLLGLRFKVVVSDERTTERLTRPFTWLFRAPVVVPVLLAFAAVVWWVLAEQGLGGATRSALYTPGLLLLVFALTVVSAGLHELGHAVATRYGGAKPGAMGAGLYLVWPAFYTDVSDSYRLSRWGRLRVDLGGLYVNALVAVAVFAAWLATREEALLLGVATQLLMMLRQLAPVVRADGYHVLADLTGVPDLFTQLRPTLASLVPWRDGPPSPLRGWPRVVVTTWVLVVVPLLLALLVGAVLLLPRLVATAWDSGALQLERIASAGAADPLAVGAGLLSLVALVLPVAATCYVLVRVVRAATTSAWRATRDRPRSRTALLLTAALLLGLVGWAWSPGSGRYVPVREGERGTLPTTWRALSEVPAAPVSLSSRGAPQLATALVPREAGAPTLLLVPDGDGGTRAVLAGEQGETAPARALPFALPDAPGEGGNQALAVGTRDGGTVYDVAYALVWVEDGEPVLNRNEAWALASCRACTTVAVAFQVVLVVGDGDVQVPVNTAVAANGGCVECVTRALAVQLVASLDRRPSEQVRADLERAFSRIRGLRAAGLDVAQLWQQVRAVEAGVVDVLVRAGLVDPDRLRRTEQTGASPGPTPDPSASADPSPEPVPGDGSTPSAESEPTPSGEPSVAAPAGQPAPEATPGTAAQEEPVPLEEPAPAEQPVEQPVEEPAEEPAEEPVQEPVAEPAPTPSP